MLVERIFLNQTLEVVARFICYYITLLAICIILLSLSSVVYIKHPQPIYAHLFPKSTNLFRIIQPIIHRLANPLPIFHNVDYYTTVGLTLINH